MNDFIVDSVLRGVLGGRRKRSRRAMRYLTGGGGTFVNAGTLLTAAGVAWGIFDTMQQEQHSESAAGGSMPATVPPVPVTAMVADDATRMIRLAISAANADGTMTEQERAAIVQQAGPDAADLVSRELNQRRPLAEIVAGITDPAQRATLYVLAFTIIRADEQVSGAERIYLAQLAHLLGLDPATVQKLETDTAQRIDAQGGPGSEGRPEGPPLRP